MHESESNAQLALAWMRYYKLASPAIERTIDEMKLENEDEWAIGFRAKRRIKGEIAQIRNEDEARLLLNYVQAQSQTWFLGLSLIMKYMLPLDTVEITDELYSYASCELNEDGKLSIKVSIGQYLSLFDISAVAGQKEGFLDFFKASSIVRNEYNGQAPSVSLKLLDYRFNDITSLIDLAKHLDRCGGQTIYSIFEDLPDATESLYDIDNIANSALGWIIAHELAHFHCGHLHHVSKKNVGSAAKISEGHIQNIEIESDLSAAIEIEADWAATSYFFHSMLAREELFRIFPKSLITNKDEEVLWKSRLIGASASVAMISLDVSRKYHGSSSHYPDPKERLFNLADNILKISADLLADGLYFAMPDLSLTLTSGILADASLVYEEVTQILGLDDRDPLFIDKSYSYGCYAGVICCDHFEAIPFDTGSPPFYLEGTAEQNFDADNEILNLLARLVGDPNMVPSPKYCDSVQANLIVNLIISHYKCDRGDLEEAWLDGALALFTKNDKMAKAKRLQAGPLKQTLLQKSELIDALEYSASLN